MAKAKKLPSGNYRVLEYSHTEIIDGKKVRKYESFTDSDKDEAEFQAAAFRRNKRKKQQPQNMTVREAIDQYIESGNAALSPTTIAGYKKIKRNHFASIMDMPLKNLSKEILQNCVNSEMKRPSKKYKNSAATLSPKTIRNAYGLMTAVFNQYCKGLDYDVKLSAPVNKIKEVLPPEIVFDVIKGTKIELACVLAMWLSFSMSEVRGLTKSKSIRNGYLAVQEVVVDVEGKPTTKDQGKTFTRTRRHKIPPYIQQLIDATDPNEDYLVTLSGQAIYKRFSRLLAKYGLDHMTFHDLRHVNASAMAELNIPDKYAMERGGWKTDRVMKRVYQHTFSETRKDVDAKIDAYFESKMQHGMQHENEKVPN